jgi:hypothetical protein
MFFLMHINLSQFMRRKTKWADKHDEADIFFFSDPREESEK